MKRSKVKTGPKGPKARELEIGGIRFLSVDGLCEVLKLSRPTILKLLKSGELVGRKLGHSWWIAETNLLRYMQGEKQE
jgi:excisionase family DNA binding protein